MTCPKCGTLAARSLGMVDAGEHVQCALCGLQYVVGRPVVEWPSYYSLQPEPLPPRGLVARMRGALRGAAAGWRGDV